MKFVTSFFRGLVNILRPVDHAPYTGFLMAEYKVPYDVACHVRTHEDLRNFLTVRGFPC